MAGYATVSLRNNWHRCGWTQVFEKLKRSRDKSMCEIKCRTAESRRVGDGLGQTASVSVKARRSDGFPKTVSPDGAYMGPTWGRQDPGWPPCWPHDPCYQSRKRPQNVSVTNRIFQQHTNTWQVTTAPICSSLSKNDNHLLGSSSWWQAADRPRWWSYLCIKIVCTRHDLSAQSDR